MIQAMVINLRRQRSLFRTVKAMSARTGVPSSTISDVLGGNAWPSLETVARLEVGLGTRLWPNVEDFKE